MTKRKHRFAAALLAVTIALSFALSGCGKKAGPSEADAKNYVRAVLDLICTGQHDKSVSFSDVEEGKETELRDQLIDDVTASAASSASLNDEMKQRFRSFIDTALQKGSYKIVKAAKTDDGGKTGYDVTVSVQPLKAFYGVGETIEKISDELTNDRARLLSMTEEELNSYIFTSVFDALEKNLEEPQYAEAQELVLHYGLLESADGGKSFYGIGSEDGKKIGEALFSLEGMEALE